MVVRWPSQPGEPKQLRFDVVRDKPTPSCLEKPGGDGSWQMSDAGELQKRCTSTKAGAAPVDNALYCRNGARQWGLFELIPAPAKNGQ